MGLEAGLNGWSGGAGKVGRLVIARMRSWAPLKAGASHSNIQNREEMVSDVDVGNVLWGS